MPTKKVVSRQLVVLVLLAAGLLWIPPLAPLPMPPGTDVVSPPRALHAGAARVWFDLTGVDADSRERVMEHRIFDEVLRRIHAADRLIVLDFFLWNDWMGAAGDLHRPLARELAEALIRKKTSRPDIPILVMTDPFNRLYGRHAPDFFDQMADAGIRVVVTDVFRLPESNLVYGRPARRVSFLLRRLPGLDRPLFPNPVDTGGSRLSIREAARLLHFKANHRKVLISDDGGELGLLVTSLNPAGGSSAHDNIALGASGRVALDALESELAVMAWSLAGPYAESVEDPNSVGREMEAVRRAGRTLAGDSREKPVAAGAPRARWLTEAAIHRAIIDSLAVAEEGDEIAVMMFYLSDRAVVRALIRAAEAGARIRVVLDVNRDAFGRIKNGIPNRPVAAELEAAGRRLDGRLRVRWAETHGEQFHIKAMAIRNPARSRFLLLAGSANWTRRNLRNLNLEANLLLEQAEEAVTETFSVFERIWSNDDLLFTSAYERHAEGGWAWAWKTGAGWVQEMLGAGTF